MRMTRISLVLAAALLLSGCTKSAPDAAVEVVSNEKRFPLTGEILAVKPEANSIRVRHDEIVGFMPAMVMDFTVNVGDLAIAKVGQRIRAELVTEGDGEFRLEKIWPADVASVSTVENAAKQLTQETVALGRKAYREIGEKTLDFTLYDQEGRVVSSNHFRGKQIVLNFVFTRCQVAKMCPAAVSRFQLLQRLAREAGVKDLEFISISLDPKYDTPGALKEYALQRGIDTSNYTFMTGPEMAVKSLLTQFGILTEFQGALLNHTAATLLIDTSGRVVHRVDGSDWDVQEFLGRMKRE